jgi:hypothetical protein
VSGPAPGSSQTVKKFPTENSELVSVAAIGEAFEKFTNLPQSVIAKVYVVPVCALVETEPWITPLVVIGPPDRPHEVAIDVTVPEPPPPPPPGLICAFAGRAASRAPDNERAQIRRIVFLIVVSPTPRWRAVS